MILLIDKPLGITSHDVVDQVRRKTDTKKVGHAGTLDPMASGLLIVGVGRESTRQLGRLALDTKKEYIAEIFLGESRDTDDEEGEVIKENKEIVPTRDELQQALGYFSGEISQVPPKYSAIKLKGKKAYNLARKGEKFNLKPRSVTIYDSEVLSYEYPILKIRLEVSAGTYIRAIARDLGEKLETGAYLYSLVRTKIGEYDLRNAVKVEDL